MTASPENPATPATASPENPTDPEAALAAWTENPTRRSAEEALIAVADRRLPEEEIARAFVELSSWPDYRPNPPIALPGLADAAGVGEIHYQDEGRRFPIESFKAWGGGYATQQLLQRHPDVTLACATDGNHGRAIAWAARQFGAPAVVFMAEVASPSAERRVRDLGAEVIRSEGNHEVAAAECLAAATEHGWCIITETEHATEPQIAIDTLVGYGALWRETLRGFDEDPPTHLFVQAGVGGLAATAAACTARWFGLRRPILVVVEAASADCIRRSLEAGRATTVEGRFDTRLAGLAAGATSQYAWEMLRAGADFALSIEDAAAEHAMKRLANPVAGDPPIVAGGSGASGLGGALAACADPEARAAIGLGPDARILTIGTEGATDPVYYQQIVGHPPRPASAAPSR